VDKVEILGVAPIGHSGLTMNPKGQVYIISCFREPKNPNLIFSLLILIEKDPKSDGLFTIANIEGIAINENTGISLSQKNININNSPMRSPLDQLKVGNGTVVVVSNQVLSARSETPVSDFLNYLNSYPKFSEWANKAYKLKPEPFSKKIGEYAVFEWDGSNAFLQLPGVKLNASSASLLTEVEPSVKEALKLTIDQINSEILASAKKTQNINNNFN
jgi:hypothetical protein